MNYLIFVLYLFINYTAYSYGLNDKLLNITDERKEVKKEFILQNPDSIDQKIYSIIFNLEEVKDLHKKYNNDDSTNIGAFITERPDSINKFYLVQVGLSTTDFFIPVYNFVIEPVSYIIKIYDTVDDEIIDLEVWRIKNKKK